MVGRCQLHMTKFDKLSLVKDDVKMVLDPDSASVRFEQPIGFEFELEMVWEYDILIFPISGSATFKGKTVDTVYQLNITQPYDGDLVHPSLKAKWKVDSFEIHSPLGNFLNIPDLVHKMFVQAMEGPVMSAVNEDIGKVLPLKYEQYYYPQEDQIAFPALNYNLDIMRRYRRFYVDIHVMGVVYQEKVFHSEKDAEPKPSPGPAVPRAAPTYKGSGMLRRYVRDFRVMEQISSKLLLVLHNYRITKDDLPEDMEIKLDAKTMELMVPGFTTKYGNEANSTLVISGNTTGPEPYGVYHGPLLFEIQNLLFDLTFTVESKGNKEIFLQATVTTNYFLKPVVAWKNEQLALNLDLDHVNAKVLHAESVVFPKISSEGIVKFSSLGMAQFLSKKCPDSLLGNGLKFRDELGTMKESKVIIDVAGRTINSWVFQMVQLLYSCLLYTSDAADDTPCVDLGGRRIIKKKKKKNAQ
eukprot:TRINITY_DN3393_c0_g1_i2.p1 TRINITY_DN3393_c0_g1~~TRINITY_DN3393_c0_g1_i2.p1  ORF type:complete len:546 (+),score=87.69 TRINITY_DN3393_c0_g1_i2:237-1640(+)